MDVRCGRCGTEYEFDDALISERGTTVKCTNCGYQFKVFPDAAATAPERWTVRTLAGRELVYTTLGDLQRGIAKGHVSATDLLSRGNRPPRPLSSIAELEPFLRNNDHIGKRTPQTLVGVAPAANSAQGGEGPPSLLAATLPVDDATRNEHVPLAQALPETPRAEPEEQSRSERALERAPTVAVGPGSPEASSESVSPVDAASAGPESHVEPASVDSSPPTSSRELHPAPPREPEPPQERSIETSRATGSAAGNLADARSMLQHDDQTDPHYVHSPPPRRARSRWVVFVVILAAGGLLAATVGRRYLAQYTKPATEPAPAMDARVAGLLAQGHHAMAEGDLEDAREAFSKASALAERAPEVLTALAELEVVRADLLWLKLRLLDPEDKLAIEHTHRELGARVGKAQRAAAAAVEAAPRQLTVQRLAVDSARLGGELAKARAQVAPVSKSPSVPENAYTLAALDMAEEAPVWSGIIPRLRSAAANERGIGRARAALIYALARSGATDAARAELDKLSKLNPSQPLIYTLKEFVGRVAKVDADAGTDEGSEAALDPSQLPKLDTREQFEPEKAERGDFRTTLKRGYQALQSGDLDQAERLYQEVLDEHPGNTEALAGLADVARQKNDSSRAQDLYQQVLEKNPSYLPALMAKADQKWANGEKQAALDLYRRVLEQAGSDSTYGRHAARRISEANTSSERQAPGAAPEPPPAHPDSESASPQQPDDQTPHIDTTDLPELNR